MEILPNKAYSKCMIGQYIERCKRFNFFKRGMRFDLCPAGRASVCKSVYSAIQKWNTTYNNNNPTNRFQEEREREKIEPSLLIRCAKYLESQSERERKMHSLKLNEHAIVIDASPRTNNYFNHLSVFHSVTPSPIYTHPYTHPYAFPTCFLDVMCMCMWWTYLCDQTRNEVNQIYIFLAECIFSSKIRDI